MKVSAHAPNSLLTRPSCSPPKTTTTYRSSVPKPRHCRPQPSMARQGTVPVGVAGGGAPARPGEGGAGGGSRRRRRRRGRGRPGDERGGDDLPSYTVSDAPAVLPAELTQEIEARGAAEPRPERVRSRDQERSERSADRPAERTGSERTDRAERPE